MTAPVVTTRLSLLGPIQIEQADQIVRKVGSQKSLAMLGYLVRHSQAVRRSTLAGLLWPDKPEVDGRGNVRWALNNLSKFFPDCFETTHNTVKFQPTKTIWLDTVAFEELAAAGDVTSLTEAAALYRGDFMASLNLDDSPELEMWLLQEREAWRQQVVRVLERLIVYHTETGQYGSGQRFATRLLNLNPWHEEAYRHLMRLLALSGQRNEALAQYERCRQVLAEGLDVEPMPETVALYEQIRAGELSGNTKEPPEGRREISLASPPSHSSASLPPCPYRGLFAFQEEDAPFFFGREVLTERLLKAVEQQAVTTVIGPSGSGKTSVVYAGLVAHLRSQDIWLIADFRPGSRPFHTLAGALIPLLEPQMSVTQQLVEIQTLGESLNRGDLLLSDIVEQIQQKNPNTKRFLLVANQFEELYTLCPQQETRHHFLDTLFEAVSPAHLPPGKPLPLNLVLTLRADFIGQALTHRPFADALQDSDIKLGPMTREELSRAIEKPAEKLGVDYETGLVERILDDVGHKSGNLPLLEFALTVVWDYEADGMLSHTAYESIGRVSGSLARYADKVYAGLSVKEQKQARRIFMQLIRPGERTEDTRRVATKAELGEDDWLLVQKLADARLVVTSRNPAGDETVEVVHEALIQNWGQLQKWLNEDRAFRIWQERLRVARRQWEANNWDEGALLRGALLAEAEEWTETRADDLGPQEHLIIDASVTLRDRRQQEAEAQRQRELAQAQALAEAEHRRAEVQARASRRLRWLAAGLLVVFLLAVGVGALAVWERNEAREEQQLALSRQLTVQAREQLNKRLALALLLARQATLVADTTETRSGLLAALGYNPSLKTFLHGHTDIVLSVAFSPDGKQLATASFDGTIRLWDTKGQLMTILTGHTDAVEEVAYSPDGSQLASVSGDGTAILWDIAGGQPLSTLTGHSGWVSSLAYSPDGKQLATGGQDQTIIVWDVASGQPLSMLKGHTGWISGIAYNPAGDQLATTGQDQTIILWNLTTGQPETTLRGHTEWVWSVAYSPDGQQLASGSGDKTVILWDVVNGQPITTLSGHATGVNYIAFNSDGSHLASVASELILWDTASGQPVATMTEGHADWIASVAFGPNGQQLVTGAADLRTILWDVSNLLQPSLTDSQPYITLNGHTEAIEGIAYHPNGTQLASGSRDKTVIVWDMVRDLPLTRLRGHTGSIRAVVFSPDGRQLATGSADETIILWDTGSYQQLTKFEGHNGEIWSMAYSPDGKQLAVGTEQVVLWDVTEGRPITTLEGPTNPVLSLAYSPDGRQLAAGLQNNSVILWDVATGQQVAIFAGHTSEIWGVVYSPDGKQLATAAFDNTIILWDVASDQQMATLAGHTDRIRSVAYSPDGSQLVTASFDQTAILWDVAHHEKVLQVADPTNPFWDAVFSPDGQTLALGSRSGTIHLIRLNQADWPDLACRIANRNLTQTEWQQFMGEQPYRATCPDLPVPEE